MTEQREFRVVAVDSDEAIAAAKAEARRAGLAIVTLARVRPAGDGSWVVVFAVRLP